MSEGLLSYPNRLADMLYPAPEYEVVCINKPDRFSTVEAITNIGVLMNGLLIRVSREQAWQNIVDKKAKYYTKYQNRKVYLSAETHPVSSTRFVKTWPDLYSENNLLSLPECT